MDDEITQKGYWVRKFRKAKKPSTLNQMVSRSIDHYHDQTQVMAAIYLAECQRTRELEFSILLDK
ncbi:hypothetical protein [Dongshaea marina]|uniref:hypothetical protein n=1 Tax=Dongshaea marina TaxID=2047966 RepID=UPI000D3E5F0A|nr:hypothetical protein [Dongshaea marina]